MNEMKPAHMKALGLASTAALIFAWWRYDSWRAPIAREIELRKQQGRDSPGNRIKPPFDTFAGFLSVPLTGDDKAKSYFYRIMRGENPRD